MAATFVQANAGTGVGSGLTATSQYGSNVTAGNLLVAVVKRRVASGRIAVCNVADDVGNKWKQAAEGVSGPSSYLHGVDVWYCDQAGGGNRPTVTATVQGYPDDAPNGLRVWVGEYASAGGLECVETTGMLEADGTTASIVTRDSCSANDLLISVVGCNASAATVPSTWTSRVSDATYGMYVAEKLDSGGAGAQTAAWTGLTANTLGYGLIVAFKPGGTRTSGQIRCVQTQYRLEALDMTNDTPGTATSPAFNSPTVGNTLLCFVSPYVDNDVVALTDDHGNTWRRLMHGGNDTIGLGQNAVWVASNCTGAASTITLTATMVAGESDLWDQNLWLLCEYVNLPANATLLASGNSLMHADSTHPTVATGDALDGVERLVVGYIGGQVNNFDGLTPDAGWTGRWSDSMGSNGVVEKVVTSSATQTAGWTYHTSQGASLFVVALGPALTGTSDYPELLIEWLPDHGPNTLEGSWSNITSYVVAGKITRGRTYETDQFETGTCELTLRTTTRIFDPEFTTGPYYGNIVPMRNLRITATYGGLTYGIFRGYVTDWGQTVPADRLFEVTITAKDAFVLFESIEIPDSWVEFYVTRDRPYHWWRLNETGDAPEAIDSGFGGDPRPGTYVGLPEQGVSLIAFDGDNTGVTFNQDEGDQYMLAPLNVDLGSNYTLEAWVLSFDTEGVVVWLGKNDGNAHAYFYFHGNDTLGPGGTAAGIGVANGILHHLVETYDGSDMRLYIDGDIWDTQSWGGLGGVAEQLCVARQFVADPSGVLRSTCSVQEVAVYDVTLTDAQVAEHYNAGFIGAGADDTASHLDKMLTRYEWPDALRNMEEGVSLVGFLNLPGGNFLNYMQAIGDTEAGYLFVDGLGRVTFYNRHHVLLEIQAIAADRTFSDAHGSGLPAADIQPRRDEALIRNPVTAARENGIAVRAHDDTYIDKYGYRHWAAPVAKDLFDNVMASRALFYLNKYKELNTRLERMVLKPRKAPTTLWPAVLSLEIAERIQVDRKPLNTGNTISLEQTVESITHTFAPRDWTTEIVGAPNDSSLLYWVLDISELGTQTRLTY